MGKQPTRGAKVIVKCAHCKQEFEARVADRQRGWAEFCSKSCKAVKQEQRTGQMSNFLARKRKAENAKENFDPHDHDPAAWESDRESDKDY